jgi:L-proline amide hydrolase
MTREPTMQDVAPFREWETWYRISGDIESTLTPLVVVHGGPGATSDYVLALAELSSNGRPVIHYDQLGGGRSTHLPDHGADFWTVDLFLDELDSLLAYLEIRDRYFLLGQSWGGMLGAEHAIRRPKGLRALVLSNALASSALWSSEAERLRGELPTEVEETLRRHEAAGTLSDPEYVAASQTYYDEHVCRLKPTPPDYVRTMEYVAKDPTVYVTMWGPNEFFCNGTLKDWSVVDQLHLITAPTLLVSGRFDEATPAVNQPFFDNIPDVQWEILEQSSHMPFFEEPDRYLDVVGSFLDEHD